MGSRRHSLPSPLRFSPLELFRSLELSLSLLLTLCSSNVTNRLSPSLRKDVHSKMRRHFAAISKSGKQERDHCYRSLRTSTQEDVSAMLIDHLHKAESRPMVAEEPLASKIRALQKGTPRPCQKMLPNGRMNEVKQTRSQKRWSASVRMPGTIRAECTTGIILCQSTPKTNSRCNYSILPQCTSKHMMKDHHQISYSCAVTCILRNGAAKSKTILS